MGWISAVSVSFVPAENGRQRSCSTWVEICWPTSHHSMNNTSRTTFSQCHAHREGLTLLPAKTKPNIVTSHSCGIPEFFYRFTQRGFLSEVQLKLNSTLPFLSETYTGVKQDLYESVLHDKGEWSAKRPAVPNEWLGRRFYFQNNCLNAHFRTRNGDCFYNNSWARFSSTKSIFTRRNYYMHSNCLSKCNC